MHEGSKSYRNSLKIRALKIRYESKRGFKNNNFINNAINSGAHLPLYVTSSGDLFNIACCSPAPQLARMYLHFTLVTAAMLCSLCGCRSDDSTAGGAAGTDGGATGSTGTRSPPTGPRGEDICKTDTFDALLTLNQWSPTTIRSKLQKKPATGNSRHAGAFLYSPPH